MNIQQMDLDFIVLCDDNSLDGESNENQPNAIVLNNEVNRDNSQTSSANNN